MDWNKRTSIPRCFFFIVILSVALFLTVFIQHVFAAEEDLLFIESTHEAHASSYMYHGVSPKFSDSQDAAFTSPEMQNAYAAVAYEDIDGTKGRAAALQTAVGLNSVVAEYFGSDYSLGISGGTAQYTVTFTNDGSAPVPVIFDFFITGGTISLHDPDHQIEDAEGESVIVSQVVAGFSVSGISSNPDVLQWKYQASIQGGTGSFLDPTAEDSWILESELVENDMNMTDEPEVTLGKTATSVYATISPYVGEFNLGMLDPGDEAVASYLIFADTRGPAWGLGGYANIGDPFGFSTGSGLTVRGLTITPEPLSCILFPVGLGVLGFWRRRKS